MMLDLQAAIAGPQNWLVTRALFHKETLQTKDRLVAAMIQHQVSFELKRLMVQ